jgi:hypothetical protein
MKKITELDINDAVKKNGGSTSCPLDKSGTKKPDFPKLPEC